MVLQLNGSQSRAALCLLVNSIVYDLRLFMVKSSSFPSSILRCCHITFQNLPCLVQKVDVVHSKGTSFLEEPWLIGGSILAKGGRNRYWPSQSVKVFLVLIGFCLFFFFSFKFKNARDLFIFTTKCIIIRKITVKLYVTFLIYAIPNAHNS